MATVVYTAPDISCGHCQMTVEKAIGQVSGVSSVKVEIPTKRVTIEYNPAQVAPPQLEAALDDAGYPIAK